MNLINLEHLDVIPWNEIKRKLDKKYEKLVVESEINETGEELNIGEFESNLVNNVILKPKMFCESFWRNAHFMRARYILQDEQWTLSWGTSQSKPYLLKRLALSQLVWTRVKHDIFQLIPFFFKENQLLFKYS